MFMTGSVSRVTTVGGRRRVVAVSGSYSSKNFIEKQKRKEIEDDEEEECTWDKPVVLSKSNERSSGLMSSLKFLLDEGFATDFEIRTSKVSLPVHRLVLAASSNYFKAMLLHNMKESNQGYVEIKELDSKAVEACFGYLYTGEIRFNDFDEIEPALKASDFLQIANLKDFLFELLTDKMSSKTCLLIRGYAITYSCDMAIESCDDFIANNLSRVAKSDQWLQLSIEEVYRCTELSKGGLSATLWEVILRWVEYDQSSREKHMYEFLKLISPINLQIVFSKILTHALIMKNVDCVRCILANSVRPNIRAVAGHINENNCFSLNSLAKRFQEEQLLDVVRIFMIDNLEVISRSARLNELDRDDVTMLMTKRSNIKEDIKFQTIAAWARGKDSRMGDFVTLFRGLDLSKVSPEFIQTTIRTDESVSSNVECCNIIMDALYQRVRSGGSANARYRARSMWGQQYEYY